MHNAPVIFALITEFGSIGLPRVTIGTIPDDDLLEILFSMLVRLNGQNTGIHLYMCVEDGDRPPLHALAVCSCDFSALKKHQSGKCYISGQQYLYTPQ